MNPCSPLNVKDLLAVGNADIFVPRSMTLAELEDEFPNLPPWNCVITDGDHF